MSRTLHRELIYRVFQAPVNLFFDVTPLGKILLIFNEDLQKFNNLAIECTRRNLEMLAHLVVVLWILLSLSDWYIYLILAFMVYMIYIVAYPYMCADNMFWKNYFDIETPLTS